MAKKKGSKAREQRRREKRSQRRKERTAAARPSVGRSAAGSAAHAQHAHPPEIPMQDEYELQGDPPQGGYFLDPHGRLAVIDGSMLRVVPDSERDALGKNLMLEGAFGDFFDLRVSPDALYLDLAPAVVDGVATLRVGVRGPSDTEVDGLVWHPTYTATIRWEAWDEGEGEGEWVFEVQQDACPGDPVGRCNLGADGTDDFWEGSGDLTSEMAVEYAARHMEELLRLARGRTAEA